MSKLRFRKVRLSILMNKLIKKNGEFNFEIMCWKRLYLVDCKLEIAVFYS